MTVFNNWLALSELIEKMIIQAAEPRGAAIWLMLLSLFSLFIEYLAFSALIYHCIPTEMHSGQCHVLEAEEHTLDVCMFMFCGKTS